MGIAWRNFEMPKVLKPNDDTLTDTYGEFIAEPFERGYGMTLGNSMRRVLLSTVEGTAVTNIKIEGVEHEFASIPGVVEDVTQIILNIKRLVIRSHTSTPKPIFIKAQRKGKVTAKDIIADETLDIINPDLLIATLTKSTKLNIEMEIGRGRGYVPAERNKKESQTIGIIPIDSLFSPVTKVNFLVTDTRVGQITDYDKLILQIWTNGAVTPKEALLYASNVLQRHLDIFVNFGKLPEDLELVEEPEEDTEMIEKLKMPVSELELSVRSANCLEKAKIKTLGELVKKGESEMLKYRNFGKKSLTEIISVLEGMGISLGMKIKKD
ncbi:MAG: DNA-directed RNA polymerase subunit alpha [Candidatus Omnitrophica bacterium]|nr:DNA-directed RNA polymerase subunit alpha [Candidatus Omnitrophota bacterium]